MVGRIVAYQLLKEAITSLHHFIKFLEVISKFLRICSESDRELVTPADLHI